MRFATAGCNEQAGFLIFDYVGASRESHISFDKKNPDNDINAADG